MADTKSTNSPSAGCRLRPANGRKDCDNWFPDSERVELALSAVNCASNISLGLRKTVLAAFSGESSDYYMAKDVFQALHARMTVLLQSASMLLGDEVYKVDDAKEALDGK